MLSLRALVQAKRRRADKRGEIAVKVTDDRGNELLVVKSLKEGFRGGICMFSCLRFKNFRCFREFTMGSQKQPLARVNLIGGMNNTGKTALLEGIFLHLASNAPNLSIALNVFRGVPQLDVTPDDLWGWLFFDKRIDDTIELSSKSLDEIERSLRIRLATPQKAELPAPGNGTTTTAAPKMQGSVSTGFAQRELVLDYEDTEQQKTISRISLFGLAMRVDVPQVIHLPMAVILTTHTRFLSEDAQRFSKLEETGRHEEILSALRLVEPRLKRLAVLVASGAPMIHGDIGIGRLVPVAFMGEGVVRLLSITLSIANAPGGIVLIDEIENGLHYSVMKDAWKAIAQAARLANVQVFATTHSWECIREAHHAFKENGPYELAYHRLDRLDDRIVAKTLNEENLERVQYTDLEIR